MSVSFTAKDATISELVCHGVKYRIPEYQRPYAWGEDQIIDFWNDLIGNEDNYFIGSFILNNEYLDVDGVYDIIDGQQRLLTITIFVAVVRDILFGIDPIAADSYQGRWIATRDDSLRDNFNIIPGLSTRNYFEKFIQEKNNNITGIIPSTKDEKLTIEEKLIRNNYNRFYGRISDSIKNIDSKDGKKQKLIDYMKLLGKIKVIKIEISSEDDAYEIFESVNARGVELTVSDLLKNLFFKKLNSKKNVDVKKIRSEMESNINANGIDMKKFMRYYWLSKYRVIPNTKLFREIKKEIEDWEKFLNDLLKATEWMNLIINGNKFDWEVYEIKDIDKIYESMSNLKYMNFTIGNTFFLSVFMNREKIPVNLTRVFQFIEKFTFLYTGVCSLPLKEIEKTYSDFAVKLNKLCDENELDPGEFNSLFDKLIQKLLSLKPEYEQFEKNFMEITYKNRSFVRYILDKISIYDLSSDEHLKKGIQEFNISHNDVNIEHFIPKNPSKDRDEIDSETKSYVNHLGNLTLVSDKINSSIGNKPLHEKVEGLKKSKIPLTIDLANEVSSNGYKWNFEKIIDRQKKLARISYDKVWKI